MEKMIGRKYDGPQRGFFKGRAFAIAAKMLGQRVLTPHLGLNKQKQGASSPRGGEGATRSVEGEG
jgi:hypothetical protein